MLAMDEWMLNDLLECSVCLERLDSTSKVLPCQHTFCKRCLEEIISSRKELRCPECRILVETKIEELPCNILLIRILEGMKNAPRMKGQTNSPQGESSQRPFPQPLVSQQNTATLPQTAVKQIVGDNRTLGQTKQGDKVQQPCARALFSYEAKEPGDLTFKKGDIILLRKKIDHNWYHGELDGKHGFFPASYVQVITPLPAHIPQCKAQYDFKMNENEEKDCLTFSKGEVITVIRRVDENWAEGRLGDRIGIFPISFVEMNSAARALMKLSVNSQPGPSRLAPPTPSSDSETTPLITNTPGAATVQPASSSSNTTPSSTSSSSSSSTTSPSSPPGSSPPAPIPYPRFQSQRMQREKRHSFTVVPQSKQSPSSQKTPSHRHSIEISPSSPIAATTDANNAVVVTSSATPSSYTQTWSGSHSFHAQESSEGNLVRKHSSKHRRDSASNQRTAGDSTGSSGTAATANPIPCTHAAVPTFYVAMYQYKPHKEDELELKKGELYTVSEKCQDGWYKGTSLRTGQSGVFPGNYVGIAKSSVLQAHFRQSSLSLANVRRSGSLPSSPSQVQGGQRPKSGNRHTVRTVAGISDSNSHSNTNISSSSGGSSTLKSQQAYGSVVTYSKPKSTTEKSPSFLDWARSVASLNPPPKPPRPHSPRVPPPVSHRQGGHRVHNAPELPPRALSPMTSSASGNLGPTTQPLLSPQPPISQSWHGSSNANGPPGSNAGNQGHTPAHGPMSTNAAVTPPNVSVHGPPTPQQQQQRSGDKTEKRDKKDKEKVSLMKRLTSKKKSKSPPPSVYSMDNPVFVDCVLNTSGSAPSPQTVHVRSGSCPSEVVFNVSTSSSTSTTHKKTNSLDESNENGSNAPPASQPSQPAPLVRERFRCIVPYPPNSEYEIELKVGDVIYVHKKRDDGWYKGTLQRTGKTGLFPASFVESF